MQPLIDAALMDATWLSVGGASTGEIRRMQKQCSKDQAELTAFVMGFTSDLGHEALGLALYLHIVVAQAFHRSRAKFRKIKTGEVMRVWKDNFAVVNELKAEGHTRAPFVFPTSLTSEPAALQYVVDALTEHNESDSISMTDDEFWRALQVLKTCCDCMHDAVTNA
jgi:hypothetical protein